LFSKDGENFFWVNPVLTDATQASAFFSSSGWKNSGGDRTWVDPEVELHLKDIDDPWNTYDVPSSIDPGNYAVRQDDTQVTMTNRAWVVLHRLQKACEVELEKTIRLTANPLRHERGVEHLLSQLDYVGYDQITTLRFISPPEPGILLGIWNLIQFPAGGHLIIPTLREHHPRHYFGEAGVSHLCVTPRFIRVLLDARKRYKLGIRSVAITGRAGYLRSTERGRKTLVVRNFFVDPSGEYVDVPWDDRRDFGYAFQCYNDDGNLGDFGELEYHTPAIGEGMTAYQDRSQVWAFCGKGERVDEVCQYLL
jgi:hypothetical protein